MSDTRMRIEVDITAYGPQPKGTPCVIVRKGEDPEPTCVNPHCPKADNCQRHIMNRTDPRTPSIAIITWYKCGHYIPLENENYEQHL